MLIQVPNIFVPFWLFAIILIERRPSIKDEMLPRGKFLSLLLIRSLRKTYCFQTIGTRYTSFYEFRSLLISSCVSCRDGARSVRAAATGRAGRSSSSSTSSLTRANRSRQGSRGTTPLAQSRHVATHSVCIPFFTILHDRYGTVPKLVIFRFTLFMLLGQFENGKSCWI